MLLIFAAWLMGISVGVSYQTGNPALIGHGASLLALALVLLDFLVYLHRRKNSIGKPCPDRVAAQWHADAKRMMEKRGISFDNPDP